MLNGEMGNYGQTRQKMLEVLEREIESGRVKALPPKEFNDLIENYEKLLHE